MMRHQAPAATRRSQLVVLGRAPRRCRLGLDLCEHVDAPPAIVAYLVGEPTRDAVEDRQHVCTSQLLTQVTTAQSAGIRSRGQVGMDASQIPWRDDMMLEAQRVAVVRNTWVLHRRIDHDLHGDAELAGDATERNVGTRQGDQTLLGASCVEESHAEQAVWVNGDLVGHAASS